MPASLAACSRGRPSSALASASRRALTRPSRSRRASRRSSAASRSVRMDKGAGTAAPPRRMPLECLRRPIDPSPARRAGIMASDEEATVQALATYQDVIGALVAEHHGRIFGVAGDGLLAEFASAVQAVRCAVAVQRMAERRSGDLAPGREVWFRINLRLAREARLADGSYLTTVYPSEK